MFDSNFARTIYQRRKEVGLSLREVSRITGIAFSTISRIERGRFSPTLDNAAKLASALQVPLPQAASKQDSSHDEATSAFEPQDSRPPAIGCPVKYSSIAVTTLKPGIRRNLSKIAARGSFQQVILLRGNMQLRTNDGFRQNLTPGAKIDCTIIIKHTYFAVASEGAELLWIG